MAGAGVVPDVLDAVPLSVAGRVVAGGCVGAEGSELGFPSMYGGKLASCSKSQTQPLRAEAELVK